MKCIVLVLSLVAAIVHTQDEEVIDDQPVTEYRGYFKREHSLIKPFQGAGMDVPYWNILGSTVVSSEQIRLTADVQARQGAIFNTVPVQSRDWEIVVSFRVHGTTGNLFGDGFAFWYVAEPALGNVFGAKDYFRGLGIFFDTYSNHNGAHTHGHPYISAMVANGSVNYDHDTDGTHTQLGGEEKGCQSKFRNQDYDTQVLIRYVGEKISVYTDVDQKGVWAECFAVPNVRLPTGYYFGFSAATGDLSDNHDIVAVKTFEQEFAHVERQGEVDPNNIIPSADFVAAPRDHVVDPKPSKLGFGGTVILCLVGVIVILGLFVFGLAWLHQRNERSRKRFY